MANTLVTLDQVAAKTFDYIIVGGGTAGLVLATRLSEDSTRSVLVLEAGGAHFDDPNIDLPASHGKIFGKEEYDWGFTTVPQEHTGNNTFTWTRGKGLGGSSATNFYLWHRPAKEDVDAWEALGNPGWNWNNFLKYSMKCETFFPPSEGEVRDERLTYDPKVHGTDGPLAIAFPTTRPGYDVIVQDTFEKLGVRRILEPQGGIRNGSAMDLTSVDPRTNRRVTSVAYLNEAGARKNLKILVNAPVARITSSSTSEGLVANGVEFILNGQTHLVSATSEVILCAGTIKSPQILELSGIGDFTILSGLGIETKVNLPTVGTNVQDHLLGGLAFELADPDKWNTVDPLVDPAVVEEQLKLYTKGEGMFTIGAVGITMVPMDALSARAIEIGANSPTGGSSPGLAEQRIQQAKRLKEGGAVSEIITFPGFYSFPNPPRPGAKHLSLLAIYNCPFSRGTIHAASTDPLVQPAIDPHYFEDDIDRQTMIEQFKFARKLAATEPFKSVLGREVNPGPEVQTDEEISVWLKKYITTVFHTSGSCSMLPRDKGGVVDPQLKVYGTTNVRVADISVVPLIPSAHMQAIAYAIAEQAADIIKGAFKA